jgi:copper chaperone CopZ
MASITLKAPAMFADHHVLKARAALLALDGVETIYASAAWQAVIVTYDEQKIEPPAIEQALADAGYGPDQVPPILAQSGAQYQDPSWQSLGSRVTETNQADLAMSGDHRKY